jgi:hypothetical protein
MSVYIDLKGGEIPTKCLASQEYDRMTFFISLFLAVGIVVSYLPQVYSDGTTLMTALSDNRTKEQ